jgi:ATP-dependent Lon protease
MSSPDSELINILKETSGGASASIPVEKPLPDRLPILGLSDIVIFPGMVAPLLVETSQSVRLIDDVVAGDRWVGLVLQKKPDVENPLPADLHGYGCCARVLRMLKFPDNSVRVLVEGLRRVKLGEFPELTPYLIANVEYQEEHLDESVEISALSRNAERLFQDIIKLSPNLAEQVKVAALNTDDPGRLTDVIAATVNLSLDERQQLLSTPGIRERMNLMLPWLNREVEVARLGSKIQSEVQATMSKSQRDYFLREQIRAIQRELGEGEGGSTEIASLREQVEKNGLSPEAKKVAFKELDRLQQTPASSAEYTVGRNYIDWLVNLPWNKTTDDKFDLNAAADLLDRQHYGLGKVKERLLEFLAVLQLKHEIKGPILCLAGPPGVGKTSLGQSVAEALGRKFGRIALGGLRDDAEIRGHRRTYVGALPGRFIQTLRRLESRNPVILLDEIDKIGTDGRGDPASALLEVLDPSQNGTFMDLYLDVPFDLSRVLFITTANWLDPIPAALRDRLEVIELPSYTAEEKFQIATRHLIPRQTKEHGLKRTQFKLPQPTVRRLINDYTHEAGVRQLDREIASLARKAARQIVGQNGHATGFKPEADELKKLLGPARFTRDEAEQLDEPGISIGMAWTPVGGEILFIEATRMPGKGGLLLTGSLGDVMKESAQTALSFLRSQAANLHIDPADLDKEQIHIHVPAGATPKDGPSAGVAIAAALASLLTRRPVRSKLAMTGEISLRGRVMRVGGIKEKVMAAARSGIREVILPEQNRNDWEEVPAEVRKKLTVHFVERVSELLPLALTKAKTP